MTRLNPLKDLMEKALEALKKEFTSLRTGRAHASFLDSVRVDMYGTLSPLNQVATISVPEPRTISVQVWDKGSLKNVERAILEANLGVNPVVDGMMIRVPMPDLSEERRREMVKVASRFAEAAKISIRNIRRDGMDELKKLEKAGDLSEDDARREGQEIQKLTDTYISKTDELLKSKEKDIMQV